MKTWSCPSGCVSAGLARDILTGEHMTIQRKDHVGIVVDDLAAAELTLVHERLDDLREAPPDIAAGVGLGWEMALDTLAALAGEAL
jgi:hypothetical protein